jgi:hypothetical protein
MDFNVKPIILRKIYISLIIYVRKKLKELTGLQRDI